MLEYPIKAQTTKTINRFTYNLYNCISNNMLKYNNDSSATLRLLSCFIDTALEPLEDLLYKPKFNLNHLDFITIDRINTFPLNKIPNISLIKDYGITFCEKIIGYSKYTNKEYDMEYIENESDFARHSYPKDMFIGEYVYSGGYELISLPPFKEINIDMKVEDSKVTIKQYSGFNGYNFDNNKTIEIKLFGIDIKGNETEETITIDSNIDYISKKEFSFINKVMSIGATSTVSIVLYPYENGEYIEWDYNIVDREMFDKYQTYLTINKDYKCLNFNILQNNNSIFPSELEVFKAVKLSIPDDEIIWESYIDKPNRLIYILTSAGKLYVFPIIIPIEYSKDLDSIKTEYQSIRIEYYEDSTREIYTFYIFPSHKTNDIEEMSIFINGIEYESNILLDLYRQNIETNKFEITFDVLFNNSDTALVEFKTYGSKECISPVFLSNKKLEPLYIKDLNVIENFNNNTISGFIKYSTTNNYVGYKEYNPVNFNIDENCTLIKLSNVSNVLINGNKIINLYNTFTFNEIEKNIYTSDTITHLKGE